MRRRRRKYFTKENFFFLREKNVNSLFFPLSSALGLIIVKKILSFLLVFFLTALH